MSDTCAFCLKDLGESVSDPLAVAAEPAPRPDHGVDGTSNIALIKPDRIDDSDETGQIGRVLPCGHMYHNDCLKPWVERANSCPVCRRNFNVVEVIDHIGGPVISSYAVEDRIQVADVDPSMLIDFVEDDYTDSQPCPICGDAENEELLLLCDGCDIPSHTYCIGLDDVPLGPWYCDQCEAQRAVGAISDTSTRSSRIQNQGRRRTRAQQRRLQRRNQANSLHWARVSQSVWDRLNLDLDFPFDNERAAERVLRQQRQEAANQREFQAWQRRFESGGRHVGSSRLMDTAAFLDIEEPRPSRPRVPREPTPGPESLEEMRAWNAFERAREIENDPSAARKRKEPTLSPSPEPAEPERKLKRPRTRRPQELAALAMQNGESSRAASVQASSRIPADNSSEPSFLQCLLKEVEEASNPSRTNSYGPSAQASNAPTDHTSPGPSSPSISPAPSNHSSPRLASATPPPHLRTRPVSPIQLGSPQDRSSPPFSPDISPSGSPAQDAKEALHTRPDSARSRSRIPGRAPRVAIARSVESSPSRAGPSLAAKSDIQKLVGAALKPYYRTKVVSKDEYTDINRSISRKLYERVGNAESLDGKAKADLEQAASEEVQKAIEALKHTRDREGSDVENTL